MSPFSTPSVLSTSISEWKCICATRERQYEEWCVDLRANVMTA